MLQNRFATIITGIAFCSATLSYAEEITLFNGKDLNAWTLDTRVKNNGKRITKDDVFIVQDGILICRGGLSIGSLRHEGNFAADYELSLEWRWGPSIASGADISIHAEKEGDEYGRRKEILVSLSVDEAGGIVYRGTSRFDTRRERQTDADLEKDMGQWNHLRIICREKMITVIENGQPVNQVLDAPLSQGGIGLGVAPVPIFYRNIKLIRPLGTEHKRAEDAAKPLAAAWAKTVARKKAEEHKREKARLAKQKREEERKARIVAERNSVIQSLRDAVAKDNNVEVAAKLDVKALPYPPDAREIDFNVTAGMIDFESGSSLKALAAFYLREMAKRGWIENEDKATMEEDSVELVFEAADATFELELDQRSDYVDVSIDTDEVEFEGTNDPGSLAALGIPQPRKALLLQKEIPIPKDVRRLSFDDDGCMFFSNMKLKEAFAHFGNLIRKKGYRESRRPIISKTRNYTEFKRGRVELSVNIFTDPGGTRIILEYDDGKKDPVLPPLPEVAVATSNSVGGSQTSQVSRRPIDVSRNQGTATVNIRGERHTFSHVSAFRSQSDIDDGNSTTIFFTKKPLPYRQVQHKLLNDENFSFIDITSLDLSVYLMLEIGDSSAIGVSVPGVGLFKGLSDPLEGMQIENGRIVGSLNWTPQDKDDDFSFTATADAVIMTPMTKLSDGEANIPTEQGEFVDVSPPMPDGAEDFGRSGTNYSKTYTAKVRMPRSKIADYYRNTLASQGWRSIEAPKPNADEQLLRFRNSVGTMTIHLKSLGSRTELAITKHDDEKAKRDNVMPAPGKGRLIMANAHTVPVVFTIGKSNYSLNAGAGAENLKGARNYSVGPGKYIIHIKIPGQPQKTETIQIAAGTAWGVIAVPTGGYLAMQLY